MSTYWPWSDRPLVGLNRGEGDTCPTERIRVIEKELSEGDIL